MKRFILISALMALCFTSCEDFLEEEPVGILTTSQFFNTQNQIQTAVDGAYRGLARPYTSVFLGLPISEFLTFSALPGFSTNPFGTGVNESSFVRLDDIDPGNSYLNEAFNTVYIPMENINTVIANISGTTVINEALKNRFLGQMYFLRAYHYHYGVKLFGEIPLKTIPTEDIGNVEVPKATVEEIYNQIVEDLQNAENSGLPWKDETGHASMGAVKTLLARVYLDMAGYPLLKGTEYYQKAYEKSQEVIASGEFMLFEGYSDLRDPANENRGEHILMVQRQSNVANSEMHNAVLPTAIPSPGNIFDSSLAPTIEFFDSYSSGDRRTEDGAFFYTYEPGKVTTYKYWDAETAVSPPSGANIPVFRYADVLLMCAEAKANIDGGTTSDPIAVDAYYQVRNRAFPNLAKPASISVGDVLKERIWELSFEYLITWFDLQRTLKTLDVENGEIVDLIGHKATTHLRPFQESDLYLPMPTEQVNLNPKLNEPAP
ncbi:MAG: RagB/SusD family nutrient uptake outer membrane protein [Anditalea sp.]